MIAGQEYPHSPLSIHKARQLNKYAVYLEDRLRENLATRDELLEALKLMHDALIAVTRALPQGEGLADYCNVLDQCETADLKAEAAIAKAQRGKSSAEQERE